jgi:soluble P-type ATPase
MSLRTRRCSLNMAKPGLAIEIPGFGDREIRAVVSDYTGTLAFAGKLVPGVKDRLFKIANVVDIHVVTSDSFGTAGDQLQGIPIALEILEGENQDVQKRDYVEKLGPRHVAAFGNGNNDRLQLRAVKEAGGLAIAVDVGEGIALDALMNAHLLISGIVNGFDLLLDPKRFEATLRF